MTAPFLSLSGITKSFSGVEVLHGIDLAVAAGEVLGLVGENGSGKSTTMNIVAGVLGADGGEMRVQGETFAPRDRRASEAAGIAFVSQELAIFPNLSVAENLFLGHAPRVAPGIPMLARSRMQEEAREWLKAVDLAVDPATPASRLSAGERQLLEIARTLRAQARLIIFDEPTTSLTHKEAERLFALIERLKADGLAIIYISHVLDDVLRLSDRIAVMRDGAITLDAPRDGMRVDDLVVAMVGREITALFPQRAADAAGEPLLRVERVSEPGIVRDIDFTVHAGEIVGIAGLLGAGRTELARILFGLDPHSEGTIRLGERTLGSGDIAARLDAGMAILTEDRRHEGLLADASVADNFALAVLPSYAQQGTGRLRRADLAEDSAKLANALALKSGPIAKTRIRHLSGGNQQKVLIGRWMLREPKLFILDEPTRGVDVGAKEEIYRLLSDMAAKGAGIIVISSEMEEVMGLADRILVMHRGCITGEFARADFNGETLLAAAFGQEKAA